MNMKRVVKLAAHVLLLSCVCVGVCSLIYSCKRREQQVNCADNIFKNDDLRAVKKDNGLYYIKNTATGKVVMRDIELDWEQPSPFDSLSVFCSKDKRGYFNSYTGEITIPAQYRRAWIFSEGLAAVQKNGMIGFINHKGETVIPFKFPYHGNPLYEFVFKNGICVVANEKGKCGVIDKTGKWIIQPEYDNVSAFKEYAIVSNAGIRKQLDYNGNMLNTFVLDGLEELTITKTERFENQKGELDYVNHEESTNMFSYCVGGRHGLMDNACHRLTEPLYSYIEAVSKNMFRARLLDGYSEVLLNAKGEVME